MGVSGPGRYLVVGVLGGPAMDDAAGYYRLPGLDRRFPAPDDTIKLVVSMYIHT